MLMIYVYCTHLLPANDDSQQVSTNQQVVTKMVRRLFFAVFILILLYKIFSAYVASSEGMNLV